MELKLAEALEMIEAARAKASEIGVPMVVAVVDASGNLIALQRMDGALLVSIEIAWNKALSTVFLRMSTEDLGRLAQPGSPLFGIHNAQNGRIVIFGGGLPIFQDGRLIGGIGVSGGTVEQDVACAQAALRVLENQRGTD